jgi:4-amino-4-deoxy-L-arabinose transferase-like glycosyltransferase
MAFTRHTCFIVAATFQDNHPRFGEKQPMSLAPINRVIPIDRAVKLARFRSLCDHSLRAIEQHRAGTLLGICVSAMVIAVSVASMRLLWFDELVTFYIAKTNSFRGIWHALEMGADPNPPLSSVLVMFSTRLFGDGQLAVRLPSIIAGVGAVLCLFLFLNRRLPVVSSAIGTLFFMSTRAFDYSYEARSYALTSCFCILSLLLWRAAVEGERRMAASAGLTLALAAGISSNYFAVLAFFPIAAGEVIRAIRNRRVELRVWVALFFGGLPIFLYLPMATRAVARYAPYAWNKTSWFIVNESYNLLLDASLEFVFVLLVAATAVYLYQRYDERRRVIPVFPAHEFVAILMLIAYPVLGYVLAVVRAGMMSPRFVLPLCFGMAMAVALSVDRLFAKSSVLMLALLLITSSWMLARNALTASGLLEQREALQDLQQSLPPRGLLVVPDSLLALPLYHYSQPSVASRIVFPFDLKSIRKFKGEDSAEQNLWAGKSIMPMPVQPIDEIDCSSPNCFIIAPGGNWLIRKLDADRTPAAYLATYAGTGHLLERGFLFGMTFGGEVNLFGPPDRRTGKCDPVCDLEASDPLSSSFKTDHQ